MSHRILEFCITTIGLAILVSCIVGEVDGIGRAAMIISGVTLVYIGAMCFNKRR